MENLLNYFLSNKNGSLLKEITLKKVNENLYNNIINYNNEKNIDRPFKERVWCYIHHSEPKTCKVCNKDPVFEGIKKGYRTYCSLTCKSNDVFIKEKVKQTFEEKYGGHPMNNNKVKEKIKNTNLQKYGTEHVLSSTLVKQKIEETNLKKYGVKRPLSSKTIQDKTKKTMLERHGVEHGLQSDIIHKKTIDNLIKNNDWDVISLKIKETKLERYSDENYNNIEKNRETNLNKYGVDNVLKNKDFRLKMSRKKLENCLLKYKYGNISLRDIKGDICTIFCDECKTESDINRHFMVMRGNGDKIICTNCNPFGTTLHSSPEMELFNILNKEGIDIKQGDRKLLNGLELDLVLPNNNTAIEFNGVYWHNELYCDKNYHLHKTRLCEDKGIELIHVFEDEWSFKQEIVLSIIKNKLNLTPNRVYARKCEIKEIPPKKYKDFCEQNHIQGYVSAKIKLGLFYDGELVSIMSLGGLRKSLGSKNEIDCYEMLRFCNKININVIGGASKLFNFFIKTYNPIEIISYSDRRYFNGDLYQKLGFKFISNTQPNYFYVKNSKREHRFKYRKDVLVKEGYNPNKTEHQIMLERKIYRIYDCGNKKWVFINQNFANKK